jgi:4a-hydroxytetrahydrobiopterin dehydratase
MNWSKENDKLERTFTFEDFKGAINFVNEVAGIAEKQKHHPSILIHSYKKVKINLTTADEGNIVTEKDYEMSKLIDEVVKKT